jgi:hypothetical protein
MEPINQEHAVEPNNKDLSMDSPTQPPPEISANKPPVSECKIQANRRNALRSTGPKTARGKRNAARNAIKHELLAREVVITAGDGKENPEEFQTLVGSLLENYEPVGPVEELLVQTIATCWWRKARALRAENGAIRKPLDNLRVDREFRHSDRCNFDMVSLDRCNAEKWFDNHKQGYQEMDQYAALQEAQITMRGHPSGLAMLRTILNRAKSEVADKGYLSNSLRFRICNAFFLWDRSFAVEIKLSPGPAEGGKGGSAKEIVSTADQQADKKRTSLIARIDDQLKKICRLEELANEREKLELDAAARSLSLPPADKADTVLRYETHLDRQLQRAMDQLERLQLRRNGQKVPPPLDISLGRRN